MSLEHEPVVDAGHVQLGAERREELGGVAHALLESPGSAFAVGLGEPAPVIEAVNTTLMPALQNQEVKDLVTKVAPAFKAHQDMAQNLLNKQTP